jgi:hypothetical protein
LHHLQDFKHPEKLTQFHTQLEKLPIKYGGHFIQIPEEEATKFGGTFPCRVICTLNGFSFHAAIIRFGIQGLIIRMGLNTLKKADTREGDMVLVLLKPDQSEFGAEMPEEFAELLLQDEEGKRIWESLSPGKQRGYLHYLNATRNPELRISRGIYILSREAGSPKKNVSGKKNSA